MSLCMALYSTHVSMLGNSKSINITLFLRLKLNQQMEGRDLGVLLRLSCLFKPCECGDGGWLIYMDTFWIKNFCSLPMIPERIRKLNTTSRIIQEYSKLYTLFLIFNLLPVALFFLKPKRNKEYWKSKIMEETES